MVLAPLPERERRVAAELERDRALPERLDCASKARLEQEHGERDSVVAATNAPAKSATVRSRSDGYPAQSGASRSAPNFDQPASATAAPLAAGDDTSQNPQTRNAGMSASFVFALSMYAVNG